LKKELDQENKGDSERGCKTQAKNYGISKERVGFGISIIPNDGHRTGRRKRYSSGFISDVKSSVLKVVSRTSSVGESFTVRCSLTP